MKKLFIILLSALSLTAVAQQNEVKRIAILETVDKVGDVNLGVKNLLRQSITFGINRVAGYEGYNRVDMAQITGEHNFQRTGYVSDSDIKKLGAMTGAQYVLIAEVTNYDATHILVYANLVDIVTGRITNSSIPKVAGTAPEQMYKDCAEVAESLLGITTSNSNTSLYGGSSNNSTPSYNSSINQNIAQSNNLPTQPYKNHTLSVDKSSFIVSYDYNVVYVTITCDTTWEVQHPTASMYSVSRNGNTLKVTIKENPFQYDRSNYFNVAIKDGSIIKKISLIQKGNPDGADSQTFKEDPNAVLSVVEDMAEFPGGQQALIKYLSENVKYPAIAQENGIQGRVICQFVVNKDGAIIDIEVVRSGGDPSLDKEAVRVIKSMPKWKPGQQRGKPVRVRYTVPINFSLK